MYNMDQIYSAAILTIVNADASCAEDDIPGVKPNTRWLFQYSDVIRGVPYITTQPDLESVVRKLRWSTRGWTYQEGFLSSRCLVFTPNQVYFQCQSGVCCEDCLWIGSGKPGKHNIGNALCHFREYGLLNPCGFSEYLDAVEGFSRRKFSVASDAFWAFIGIINSFLPKFPDGGFVWGLPVQALDAALVWFPCRHQDGLRKGVFPFILDHHTIRLSFPTWPWVSWGGGVDYDAMGEQDVKSAVEWQRNRLYAVDPAEPLSGPWYLAANWDALLSAQKFHQTGSWKYPLVLIDERSLGFLRFKAQSASFDVEIMDLDSDKNYSVEDEAHDKEHAFSQEVAQCSIRSVSGESIGSISVPVPWLEAHSSNRCEFVLLSTNIEDVESETCPQIVEWDPNKNMNVAQKIRHMDSCEHQSMHNVMLIDWKQGPHCQVAVRMGITQIHKDDWIEAETTWKLIVLG